MVSLEPLGDRAYLAKFATEKTKTEPNEAT